MKWKIQVCLNEGAVVFLLSYIMKLFYIFILVLISYFRVHHNEVMLDSEEICHF